MIPVRPVIIHKPELKPIMVAKDQPEYQTLPALYMHQNNICLSRWALDENEILALKEYKTIYLYQMRFGKPMINFFLSSYFVDAEQMVGIYLVWIKNSVQSRTKTGEFHMLETVEYGPNHHKTTWNLSDEELMDIHNQNSFYVYQFNLKEPITPMLLSVYSDERF